MVQKMLELCTGLHECEKILWDSLDGIEYLSEVNFSLADIDKLAALLRENIARDEEAGIRYLEGFPACVSIYLVGKGAANYQGGEFWPPVLAGIGAVETRSQYVLGKIFFNLVRSKSLAEVEIRGALSFVTPILMHGGIPLSGYKMFYEQVVSYFLHNRLVEENQIRNEVATVRDKEEQRADLLAQKEGLQSQEKTHETAIEKLEKLGGLFCKQEELKKKIAGREELADFCHYRDFLSAKEVQQLSVIEELESLLKTKTECHEVINHFTANDQKLLEHSGQIEELTREYEPYQEAWARLLAFDEILDWGDLLDPGSGEWQGQRRSWPPIEVVWECIWQAQTNRLEAEHAGDKLAKEILPALDLVERRRVQVAQEIAVLEEIFVEIGRGDLATGIQLFEEMRQVLQELEKAGARLVGLWPDQVQGSLADALKLEQKLGREISDLETYQELKRKQAQLKIITGDIDHWADLPDYREFMASTKVALDEIEHVLAALREQEGAKLAISRSVSKEDRLILDHSQKIKELSLQLLQYREWQQEQGLLREALERRTRRIAALVEGSWPGEWKEDYGRIISGLDMGRVEEEFARLFRFLLETSQMEESLADCKIKKVPPGPALLAAGILAVAGLGVFFTVQGDFRHLAWPLELAALAIGFWNFKQSREHPALQEKHLKALAEVNANLEKSRAELTKLLDGLPLTSDLTSLDEGWLNLVRQLHQACCDCQRLREEMTGLKQGIEEWEAASREIAAACLDPLPNTPGQVVAELKERVKQAGLRAKEAEEARKVLEKEIRPAIDLVERRKAQLVQEVGKIEQRFIDLGEGILAVGVGLAQDKKKALEDLKGIDGLLEGLDSGHRTWNHLDEALRLQRELGVYIGLKKRQAELGEMGTFPHVCDHIPDPQELIIVRKKELASLQKELNALEEKERCQQALVASYFQADQRVLKLAEKTDIRELSTLRMLVDNWEDKLRLVVNNLSFPATETPLMTLNQLTSHLRQTAGRKAQALKAHQVLLAEIQPALDQVRDKLARVEQEIAAFEQRIREIGEGDLTEGKRLLDEHREAQSRLDETRNAIEQFTSLSQLPPTWQEVKTMLVEKNLQLNATRRDLFYVDGQLGNINSPFAYEDEPVQRFVIYGGQWAIQWLWAGTCLHRYYLGEQIDLTAATRGLPDRVVQGLTAVIRKTLGKEKRKRYHPGVPAPQKEDLVGVLRPPTGAADGLARECFPQPEILFDASLGELKIAVGGYSFQIFDQEIKPELFASVVSGGATSAPDWSTDITLRGYRRDGMVEIPLEYIFIPHIAQEYLVTLTTGKRTHTWRVQAYDQVPCLIFNEGGKLTAPERLSKERAWLLFPDCYHIANENVIVSSDDILFNSCRYHQVLVDFQQEPVIGLVGEDGLAYEISSNKYGLAGEPHLTTEETALGVKVNEKSAIYTGVPKLKVPFVEDQIGNQWTVQVVRRFIDETIVGPFVQMEPVTGGEENEYFDIDLELEELLGPSPLGEYTIVLDQGGLSRWEFDVVIIPDLMVFFEQQLYFPTVEGGAQARLTLVVPEALGDALSVTVKEQGQIIGQDEDEYHVSVDLDHDELEIQFWYKSAGKQGQISATVEIPKVCWRLVGGEASNLAQWQHRYQEVWHEACCGPDNPHLELKLPGYISNLAQRSNIFLEETGCLVTAKNSEGPLNFDLSGLTDSLRGGKDIYSLWFALTDIRGGQLARGKLLDLRCRWRAEHFQYEVEESPHQWLVKASWVDLGVERDRVARLLRLWEPWVQPLTFSIPDGSSRLDIPLNWAEASPGPYLLSFGVDDLWSGETLLDKCPGENENSVVIYLPGNKGHILVNVCAWQDKNELFVEGALAGGVRSKKIVVSLYGVYKGKFILSSFEKATDDRGYFNLSLKPSQITRPHWLGIYTKEHQPLYYFQILPQAGALCWPLSYAEASIRNAGIKGSIYIDSAEERVDSSYLGEELSLRVLRAWGKGRRKYDITIWIGGQRKKAQLCKGCHLNDAVIELETGVIKCTTCGGIEPNQQAWDQKHYPKGCKGFKFNYREMKASLYWEWDPSPVLKAIKEYLPYENHLLVLYHNLHRPLPDDMHRRLGGGADHKTGIRALINLLWARELDLLQAGGLNK